MKRGQREKGKKVVAKEPPAKVIKTESGNGEVFSSTQLAQNNQFLNMQHQQLQMQQLQYQQQQQHQHQQLQQQYLQKQQMLYQQQNSVNISQPPSVVPIPSQTPGSQLSTSLPSSQPSPQTPLSQLSNPSLQSVVIDDNPENHFDIFEKNSNSNANSLTEPAMQQQQQFNFLPYSNLMRWKNIVNNLQFFLIITSEPNPNSNQNRDDFILLPENIKLHEEGISFELNLSGIAFDLPIDFSLAVVHMGPNQNYPKPQTKGRPGVILTQRYCKLIQSEKMKNIRGSSWTDKLSKFKVIASTNPSSHSHKSCIIYSISCTLHAQKILEELDTSSKIPQSSNQLAAKGKLL